MAVIRSVQHLSWLKKNGFIVTASDGNQTVTRNSSMFKVVPSYIRHAGKITQEQADED